MSNLYRITNSKAFTVLLFITAVLLKIGIRRIFFGFGSDKLGQIVITRNFLSGHGISIVTVSTNDLSQTIYQFSPDWPIGFNMLLSPFWLLCDGDYVTATFLVDCLSVKVVGWIKNTSTPVSARWLDLNDEGILSEGSCLSGWAAQKSRLL